MTAKALIALVCAAAFALIVAAWLQSSIAPLSESNEHPTLLLPTLGDRLNDVDRVLLTGNGAKVTTTLVRSADGWRIAEKSDYPAETAKVREFLLKLGTATVLEEKTSNPTRYAELGVDDVAANEAKGILVTLHGPRPEVQIIIGLYNGAGGGGTFVRRPGVAQSELATGNLLAERDPAAWLKHDLIDIDESRIKEVRVTDFNGKALRIEKAQLGDPNFKILDVPKGREVASGFVANSLASGLASLRIDDVSPASAVPVPEKSYKVQYVAFGGFAVNLSAWDANGKNAIQLVASNDATQLDASISADHAVEKAQYETAVAAAKVKAVEARADDDAIAKAAAEVPKPLSLIDPAKDRANRIAAADLVVEKLNRSFTGWTFFVPAYAFANFNKSMDDMLKPLQPETNHAVRASSGMTRTGNEAGSSVAPIAKRVAQ